MLFEDISKKESIAQLGQKVCIRHPEANSCLVEDYIRETLLLKYHFIAM